VRGGFDYKTVPHITLGPVAQNTRIDTVVEKYRERISDYESRLADSQDEQAEVWKEKLAALKRERQKEIDRIIAEDAPQEILYDRPEVERNVVRVSGPFTVEAIPPPIEDVVSPIGGAPEPEAEEAPPLVSDEGAAHIPMLIELLREDGVTFPDNKSMTFAALSPRGGGTLHAEGEPGDGYAEMKSVAVSFGPLHGPVTDRQVEDGLREAYVGGFDAVVFCGFAFDAQAQAAIEAGIHPKVQAFLAHIRPDVIMTDASGGGLLKTTAKSQLFTVFGEPDVELRRVTDDTDGDEKHLVELRGVDVYDPISGEVHSARAGQIAAWFLDTDYDGRTFCICQAFFPNKSAWSKLERALKGTLDKERFEQLTGTASLPFPAGEHKRAAVKVIDQRGNEVMRILMLDSKGYGS
jgi:adenine-specific DNA-methyltransferase